MLGISKRCCPVCAFLIQKLGGFVIRGAHKSVTGCSLPPWLPNDTKKIMVDEFGRRLRMLLDNILFPDETTETEGRKSTGSICLSIMSFESSTAGSWAKDVK
jgi:hypothetical protein